MTDESMADRAFRKLSPDREVQLDEMRRWFVERGHTSSLNGLEKLMNDWQREFRTPVNPVTAMVGLLTSGLTEAMVELGADRDRMAEVRVTSTLQEDVSAQITQYVDGTSLVRVSDATLSLADMFNQYIAAGMVESSRVRKSSGQPGSDPTVLIGLLRYYNVNQRNFGLAAKLGLRATPQSATVHPMLSMFATQFILGHEMAHHALAHRPPVNDLAPDEHLPIGDEDHHRLELEADLHAYRASATAAQREFGVSAAASEQIRTLALWGAMAGILAIQSTERALFVRSGITHPPATRRMERLLEQAGRAERTAVTDHGVRLATAVETAATFDPSVQPFDWERFAMADYIDTPQPSTYLRTIGLLDALQCLSEPRLVQQLSTITQPAGNPVTAGAHEAAAGQSQQALLSWGVTQQTAALLMEPRRALTFYTLLRELKAAMASLGVPEVQLLAAPTMAARLIARSLGEVA